MGNEVFSNFSFFGISAAEKFVSQATKFSEWIGRERNTSEVLALISFDKLTEFNNLYYGMVQDQHNSVLHDIRSQFFNVKWCMIRYKKDASLLDAVNRKHDWI